MGVGRRIRIHAKIPWRKRFQQNFRVLGLESLNSEIREVIQNVINNYCADKARYSHSQIPHQNEVRETLKEIETTAKKLIGCLEKIDTVSRNRLEDASLPSDLEKLIALFDKTEKQDSDIHAIAIIAQKAMDNLPPARSGRTKEKLPLKKFLIDLAVIYETATAKKPTTSWPNPDKEKLVVNFSILYQPSLRSLMQRQTLASMPLASKSNKP